MCDTLCLPGAPRGTYFAKNSDRSPNEPHLVLRVPGRHHVPGTVVKCTYIAIPQVEYTREVILCKPSWIWGAEMGVNEAGVAIGNEAVFTKSKTKRAPPALTGMDLLRLALERADTAKAAVEVMTSLLEAHGQGGNCGFDHDFRYDNSFLAADPGEAYILETSGKRWAVKRAEGPCAISNRLTLEPFAKQYTEPVFSHFSRAKERRCQVLERLAPGTDAAGLMSILRTHAPAFAGHEFSRASVGSVCMHAGGPVGDHTTGSLVAVLRKDKPATLWVTGASTPCIAAFQPVFWGSDAPPLFTEPEPSLQYWLQRERLHRAVIAGLVDAEALRIRIAALEAHWLVREQNLMSADTPDMTALHALSRDAAGQEQSLVDEFSSDGWQNLQGHGSYTRYWQKKNKSLGTGAPHA